MESETSWRQNFGLRNTNYLTSYLLYSYKNKRCSYDVSNRIKKIDNSNDEQTVYNYDEWVNIINQNETMETPIKYLGEYYDKESENYYLKARYYNPASKRFISRDGSEGDITNPLSMNKYAYCEANPVLYIDDTGNQPNGLNMSCLL